VALRALLLKMSFTISLGNLGKERTPRRTHGRRKRGDVRLKKKWSRK